MQLLHSYNTSKVILFSHVGQCTFPDILLAHGLTEELLSDIYHQVAEKKQYSDKWAVAKNTKRWLLSTITFIYQKWYLTLNATKTAIGVVYLSIDTNLREKGGRPDNIYRFVNNLSDKNPGIPMPYYHTATVNNIKKTITKCNEDIQALTTEVFELKQQLQESREQLETASIAFNYVISQRKLIYTKKCCAAQKKVEKLEEGLALNEADIFKLFENEGFSKASFGKLIDAQSDIFISKCGGQFTPAI